MLRIVDGMVINMSRTGIAVAMLLAGCGGGADDVPQTFPVTGVVKLDGQPLPEARVTFIPEGEAACAGITDAEGRYVLKHRSGAEGAPPGAARVQISTDLEGTGDPANERVPARYNGSSELTANVAEEENTINFDLETK